MKSLEPRSSSSTACLSPLRRRALFVFVTEQVSATSADNTNSDSVPWTAPDLRGRHENDAPMFVSVDAAS